MALSSGLALAVLAVGAGATWAATSGDRPVKAGAVPAASPSAPGAATPAKGVPAPGPVAPPDSSRPDSTRPDSVAPPVEVSGPDGLPTAPVKLVVGQSLVVHLAEQAGSTGYSWSPTVTGNGLVGAGDTVIPAPPSTAGPVVGAAGDHAFTFRATKDGTVRLTFALQRPWNKETARTVTLTVNVGTPAPAPAPKPTPAQAVEISGPEGLPTTPVALVPGQRLVVHLREQAGSTGFSWATQQVSGNLKADSDRLIPGPNVAGSVGDHVFIFEATKVGDGRLTFLLRRPGTGEVSTRAVVRVRVGAPARTVDVRGPQGLPKSVAVKVGDTLVVHLAEQAGSTGYSWAAVRTPKNLTAAGNTVVPGPGAPDVVGAAGEHVFTFRVGAAGSGMLLFALNRPGASGPANVVAVQVSAQG